MNSKEFLNKLIVFSKEQINYYENKVVEDEKYPSLQQCHQEELISTQEGLNHFLKIKQDLERLEKLEIANKNNEGLVRENVDLINRNLKLQDELKKCQDTIKKWMKDNKQLIIDNGKLKKAVDILKEKLDIKLEVYHSGGCTLNHKIIPNCVTPNERCLRYLEVEEYELLKRFLEEE